MKNYNINFSKLIKNWGITLVIPIFMLVIGAISIFLIGGEKLKDIMAIGDILFWSNEEIIGEKNFLVGEKEMKRPSIGDEFGKLIIPELNFNKPIFHGDGDEQLQLGIGHFAGSSIPGEDGNFILTGKRQTTLKEIKNLKVGQVVIFEGEYGTFKYVVKEIKVVKPNATIATKVTNYERLTLYTGYPFESIGKASERIVIICNFIESSWKE
ncbi:class D sortase [Clostridium tarantellae]|uniref:Sortase n=1 Tax=Clostridium tarantellae TaxID=39493 RepID=A0A6I1MMH6_9CLOT|nr:class D sortase [Clostridium tarantellae]MPQ43658.1 sortase [Clostridium tarantellae]